MLKKQQLALDDRKFATMKITRRLGEQLRKLEKDGVNVDKQKLQLSNAARHTAKGRLETARASNKLVADEIKGLQKVVSLNKQAGRTGFTAAQYGPQMANTYGAGQAAMNVDTKFIQQTTRLKIAHDLNMLELKGVDISKLRTKLGKLTDAQRKREFGLVRRLNRELTNGIKKENNKLAILREQERINRRRSRAIAAANAPTTGGRGGGGAIFQSALISGGFPLLFGQGPVTAIGGALGGGIGAAVGGQMGGFAGGIVGTAIIQTITNVVNGINELGGALADPANNIDKLTESLSKFDKNILTSVQILQSAGLTASAGQFARARFGMQFGAGGANSLEEMNKAFKEFAKVTTKLGTELAILASGPLTGFMKMLNFVLGGGGTAAEGESLADTIDRTITERENAIEKITNLEISLQENLKKRNELRARFDTKEKSRELAASGELGKVQAEFRRLGSEIQAGKLDLGVLKDQVKNFDATVKLAELQRKILKENEVDLRAQLEIEKARFEGSEEELIVLEQRNKLTKLNFAIEKQIAEVEAVRESGSKAELERAEQTLINLRLQKDLEEQITLNRLNAADPAISRMNELNKKMRELNDITEQSVKLSKVMGDSFAESFKGVVRGTMTVQDAFRNMLNRIADFFIDTAAQLAATQLQRSILGLFGNMFNFSTTPLNDIQNTPVYAANGGPVGMRNPYIVGERGPELFVPNQSGNIIPNHDLAGLGGGSTTVVVNVDASGSSVEGDEQQSRELGRLISVAVQSELIQQKRPGGLLA
ncbi:MAG: hypothetical protein CMF74_19260 [Maricaulis sp.]|nr:hypothetical protein [Maricaulis sp.]